MASFPVNAGNDGAEGIPRWYSTMVWTLGRYEADRRAGTTKGLLNDTEIVVSTESCVAVDGPDYQTKLQAMMATRRRLSEGSEPWSVRGGPTSPTSAME